MKKLLAILTAALMLLSLAACGQAEPAVNTTAPETSQVVTTTAEVEENKVSVTVKDSDGNPIKGVMLQICKDTCVPMVTDENGVAVFNNMEATAEHKLSVLSCPEGYVYNGEPEMYLVEGVSEYAVELDAR